MILKPFLSLLFLNIDISVDIQVFDLKFSVYILKVLIQRNPYFRSQFSFYVLKRVTF